MTRPKLHFFFLNLGHAYDHLFILVYPTVVLALQEQWQLAYGDLLLYGTVGMFAFGAASIPAGWLGDRWSRTGMMVVFFVGIGLAAIATAAARTPLQIGVGIAFIGTFAAIYHPVGIAMVFGSARKAGRALAVNGVWGNLGLAAATGSAALLTELFGWQAAFVVPGTVSVLTGLAYWRLVAGQPEPAAKARRSATAAITDRRAMLRIFAVIAVVASFGGMIFHSMTTALPKVLAEGGGGLTASLAGVGGLATLVFAVAALAQLVVGELLDRYPAPRLLMALTGAQALMLYLAPLGYAWLLVAIMLGLMLAIFGQIPVNDWLIGHYAANEWRSRFYALKYTLGLGVAALAYWLVAELHRRTGDFDALYWVLAVMMTLVAVAASLLPVSEKAPDAPEVAVGE